MWSDYVSERLGWKVIEKEGGFIAFCIEGTECSIEEFYVEPMKRRTKLAKSLADEVFEVAKEAGCKSMWAKITPGIPGAEHAMRTNLHYGFKLAGCRGNDIILHKSIGGL